MLTEDEIEALLHGAGYDLRGGGFLREISDRELFMSFGRAVERAASERMREQVALIVDKTRTKIECWIDESEDESGFSQAEIDTLKACALMTLMAAKDIRALPVDKEGEK